MHTQKSRHHRSMSNFKQNHEAAHRERLLEVKSQIKTELYQKLDDLRSDYEHKVE